MDHSSVNTSDAKQNPLQESLDGEQESSSPEMVATINPAYSKPSQIARMLNNNPSPSNILSLQRTVGNRVVQRLLHPPKVQRADEEQPAAKEGTLPDMQLEEDTKQLKGPEEEHKEDGTTPKTGRAATAGDDSSSPGTFQISVGNLGVEFNNPQVDISSNSGAKDAVESGTVGTEWTNPGTKTVSPFGSESFIPGYKNLKWKAGDDKAKPSFKVDFTLSVDCPWGVNGGGKTDVPSATDGVVTAEPHAASGKKVYEQIVADLTPALNEKSWRAPRQYFWSKAICARHETYHSTDDKAWVETTGKKLVTDYLNTQSVSAAKTEDDLKVHLTKAMKDLGTANFAFYTGGASSYYSYAGEERAFGDGKAPYLQLAKEVGEQGAKLEAAKAPTPAKGTP